MAASKIGIFSGAGSGKSEVTRIFKNKYGAYVIEADKVVHELYHKNESGYKAVLELCGACVLDSDMEIDRSKLAEMLYADDKLRAKINSVIHALAYDKIRAMISEIDLNNPYALIVYEAAILPDKGQLDLNHAIYVYTPLEIRRKRLKETRNYSDNRIDEIIRAQASEEEYRNFCDMEIINDGSLKKLEEQVDEAFKYCQRQQR